MFNFLKTNPYRRISQPQFDLSESDQEPHRSIFEPTDVSDSESTKPYLRHHRHPHQQHPPSQTSTPTETTNKGQALSYANQLRQHLWLPAYRRHSTSPPTPPRTPAKIHRQEMKNDQYDKTLYEQQITQALKEELNRTDLHQNHHLQQSHTNRDPHNHQSITDVTIRQNPFTQTTTPQNILYHTIKPSFHTPLLFPAIQYDINDRRIFNTNITTMNYDILQNEVVFIKLNSKIKQRPTDVITFSLRLPGTNAAIVKCQHNQAHRNPKSPYCPITITPICNKYPGYSAKITLNRSKEGHYTFVTHSFLHLTGHTIQFHCTNTCYTRNNTPVLLMGRGTLDGIQILNDIHITSHAVMPALLPQNFINHNEASINHITDATDYDTQTIHTPLAPPIFTTGYLLLTPEDKNQTNNSITTTRDK
jgi:hypothetical protein